MLLQLHHQFADGVGVSNILPLGLPPAPKEERMDLEKIYYDMDGNKKNILEMVKLYPEWAANVIQWYCEKCTDGFEGSTQKKNGTKTKLNG